MAISSYPRTIKNGQIASNGNANSGTGLMLWDSATNTYIAATPSTFAGAAGGATAANQATQITEAQTGNSSLTNIDNNTSNTTYQLANGTNTGTLSDTFATQVLTASMVALSALVCKSVTLINLSTNTKFTYRISTGTALTLEAGYSVKINIENASDVQIQQSTGEGNTAQIIITA